MRLPRDSATRGLAVRAALSALSLTSSLLYTACGRPDPARAGDLRVRDAVERLRGSTGGTAERRLLVTALRGLPASSPTAAEAQRACAAAYTDLCEAEDAVARAEQLIKQTSPTAELPEPLVAGVARADELIKKARAALPECDAAAARLALHVR